MSMPRPYLPRKITHAGVDWMSSESGTRAVILTNVLEVISSGLALFNLGLRLLLGWDGSWQVIAFSMIGTVRVPYLNYQAITRLGRVILSLAIPATAIIAAFRPRISSAKQYSPALS